MLLSWRGAVCEHTQDGQEMYLHGYRYRQRNEIEGARRDLRISIIASEKKGRSGVNMSAAPL